MLRKITVLPLLAAFLVSCYMTHADAQSAGPSRHRQEKAQTTAPPLAGDALKPLIAAQAEAVQSGDATRISEASKDLLAETLALLARLQATQGQPASAVESLRQSLTIRPDTAVQLQLASALLDSGDDQAAVEQARTVTTADPNNATAWTMLGNALRASGQSTQAVAAFTRALELNPNESAAFTLASALLAAHEKSKAEDLFRRILTASGNRPIWHVAVGDAYREAGYLPEAVASFKQALAADPAIAHGEFFLGLTYLQMNQWGPNPDSFLHLRRAVEQSPKEYLSNFYLGALESTDGSDLASSDRHLHTAAQADPTQPEVWIYLGQNANREHRSEEAKTYLRRAIDLTGSDESRNNYQIRRAYFSLGRLLMASGDRDEGERLLAAYKRTSQAAVAEAGASIAQTSAPPGSDDRAQAETLHSVAAASAVQHVLSVQPPVQPSLPAAIAEKDLRAVLVSAWNDLGTSEARQQRYGDALRDFQQAERWAAPANTQVLRNIGVAAYRSGDFKEAQRAFDIYFKQPGTTGDQRAHVMNAMAHFDSGHFAVAASNFQSAGELATSDPRIAYSYAFSLARTGHDQEANQLADKLSAQQLPPEQLSLVCHLYFDAENYKGSEACYRKLTAAVPGYVNARYFIGESLIHQDRPSDAIPELRAELATSPGEPNVSSALAFALLQTSQKDEARALLQQTVTAHPDHADAQFQYGKLLMEDGKAPEAIPHLEASEKADTSKGYVHYQLATAYRKAGRATDAEREFKLYREIKDKHRNDRAIPTVEQATH